MNEYPDIWDADQGQPDEEPVCRFCEYRFDCDEDKCPYKNET